MAAPYGRSHNVSGSGLCGVQIMGLGTSSIRRWPTRAMLKHEREPVSYCAAAMSAWFERARYDGHYGTSHHRATKEFWRKGKEIMIEIRKIITTRETVFSE